MNKKNSKPVTVRPVHPNAGIEAMYRKRLLKEIREMQHSVLYWLRAAYRAREDEFAADASPTAEILAQFKRTQAQWIKRWRELGRWLSKKFVGEMDAATENSLKQAFKAAGFTVNLRGTRLLNTAKRAMIAENVNLITSIPDKYFQQIEGALMRGIVEGRDLAYVTREITRIGAVSESRARMIARDQADKTSLGLQRIRDEEAGITEGIWVHIPGKYSSRETHIAMNGQRFKLAAPEAGGGLYDSDVGENVLPGQCINCRCIYRRILPPIGAGAIRPIEE